MEILETLKKNIPTFPTPKKRRLKKRPLKVVSAKNTHTLLTYKTTGTKIAV